MGLVTTFGGSIPSRYFPGHSGPLSLAIPPWVGALSRLLAMASVIAAGRNGKFGVALAL